jgi:hypothetical protein
LLRILLGEARVEYNVDRRVILSAESEHKSLYEWSISEVTPEGKNGAVKQIPWPWTLWFEATNLALYDTLETEFGFSDGDKRDAVRPANFRRSITAKLRPSRGRRASWEEVRYSFFGTERFISKIELRIEQLSTTEDAERCELWGSPSYTSEGADFRPETTEDYLGFNLFVKPETFARFATQISLSSVTGIAFGVGGVPGFYSDWSPTVVTNRVKILSSLGDQRVEKPEGCEIDLPRLGTTTEFHLVLSSAHNLEDKNDDVEERADEFDDEEKPLTASGAAQLLPHAGAQNQQLLNVLKHLRVAAWLIVALLAFQAVF